MTRLSTGTPLPTDSASLHALDPAQREQAFSRIDELAMRAGRSERSNKPTILLLLAVACLVGAFIFLLSSLSRLSEARDTLASRRENAENMVLLAAQLRQIREFASEGTALVQDPDPQMLSRLAQIGTSAGLADPLPIPTKPKAVESREKTAQRVKWVYRISDPALSSIMRFVSQVERDIPGMKVHSIKITPSTDKWSVEVTFSRVERTE